MKKILIVTGALALALALPACGKKNKDKKDDASSFEESQECKDFKAEVDKSCASPSEANQGVCDSMKSTLDSMKKSLDFAKGKLPDALKKARTEQCAKTLDALKKSIQP
jgi:hypothetical protein